MASRGNGREGVWWLGWVTGVVEELMRDETQRRLIGRWHTVIIKG